jgi:DNA polymerase-3 subunit delta'
MHFVFPVNKTREVDTDSVTSDDFMTYWRKFLSVNPYGRLTQWFDYIELENKQGIISTEESKRLLAKLSLKSFESDYKVVIIWQPEKMNDQAGNKLLKLLEEPPPLTIFILVSENPEHLLATVRSRCIPVKVPRIADNEMLSGLIQRHQLSQERATEVARFADGNYLKALEFMTANEDAGTNFARFRELMRSCLKSSIPELIKQAEELSVLNRESQKSFLEYGLGIIRESMVVHFKHDDLVRIPENEMEFTHRFAPFINGRNVVLFESELNRAIRDIERNGNGKIIFMDLALQLSDLIER